MGRRARQTWPRPEGPIRTKALPSRERHRTGRSLARLRPSRRRHRHRLADVQDQDRSDRSASRVAYLVDGPDAVENSKIIRHLILSAADLGAKIAACETMSCTDADLSNGMTIDLDAGPRLSYWVVLNELKMSDQARRSVERGCWGITVFVHLHRQLLPKRQINSMATDC